MVTIRGAKGRRHYGRPTCALLNRGLCCAVRRALVDALRHFRIEQLEAVFTVTRRRSQFHGFTKAEMPNVEDTQIKSVLLS